MKRMSSSSRSGSSRKRGNDRRYVGSKPVEDGKEYDVQIIEKTAKGDCIAKVQGYVIFIAGGEVGQTVKIKVTNVGERAAKAELVEATKDKASEAKPEVAPPLSEEEKPELRDYKSTEDTHT
jgi:predicted RNA-binding protein with TRAM domain